MLLSEPKFQVGDIVRMGKGKVQYRVAAVITTGRYPIYDLICVSGLRKGEWFKSFSNEHRLSVWSSS